MKCPYCSTSNTKVIDSRINQTADITRRRRKCPQCDARFTTYERVEELMPVVIKKDGRREPFSRDKVIGGLKMAFLKRPVETAQVEFITRKIEKSIQGFGLKEIPSQTIGKMLMTEIHDIDQVAYVRFASVYKKFKDVEDFVKDIKKRPRPLTQPESLSFSFISKEPEKDSRENS
ncbi:MAG: transcriptional regulator NrdR [Bdellovibrionaceae bacterium]|nr:transcriptional regulator NrdR [Pseudobdellovibrionaceae bacterium]